MKYIICSLLLVHFIYFACGQKTADQIAIIKTQRAASNAAIAKHDIEGIAKYWMPDFIQVRGNATYLVGKDAVMNTWKELFKTNPEVSYTRSPSEIIISKNDSLAWEKGKWMAVKSYSKGGNYAAMWRKINNEWKIQAEIFVSLH
ncbi:MAG: nuclear transport factor 2 family protein [Chitinophagaceae bacterium]